MRKDSSLHGVIATVPTPFNNDYSIDYAGLRNIVRGLCDDGVHGLLVCGSGGEFGSLTSEEREKIAEITIAEVGDRVPVIVHVGHSNMFETVRLAEHAQKIGASAIMCLPPYLLAPTQEDMYEYFSALAKRVDIDVVGYNNPRQVSITIDATTIIHLAKSGAIRYVKDSVRNLRHTSDVIQGVGDSMVVLSGETDLFLPILALGGKGGITIPASIVPRKIIDLYDAFVKGDLERARKVHYQVMELVHVLGSEGKVNSCMKAALRIQGRPGGPMRPPISDVSENCKQQLREVLKKLETM
jgi:4-hydroxy-tetrahydrodipicolinate synthase